MYELVSITSNCFYIESPAKIGLLSYNDKAYLIDSGSDASAAKKVKRHLDERSLHLEAIFNTHSHADHIGGNRYLQKQTLCNIYAPGIECDFTLHPILEPSYLYGGNPFSELRHKFLMAESSEAKVLTKEDTPEGLSIIPLPGHSFDMVGFRTCDDVVFLADALSSERTLEKYQISFLVDVKSYLETLEEICKMSARCFVPSHAEMTENIEPLARVNIAKVHEICETIISLSREKITFEELLKKLFDHYSLQLNYEQYVLVGSTLRSYITYLKDKGELKSYIEDNRLLITSGE